VLFLVFAGACVVVTLCGVRLTDLADRLADRTGLGEALVGGVILGAATSLSGTVVTVAAALDGRASLAFSNGVGGIAAQTAFLALADLLYRRANLEHAAVELANLFQSATLILLLTLPLLAFTGPDVSFWGVHPVSVALVAVYAIGIRAARQVRENPMWQPKATADTHADTPDDADSRRPAGGLALRFVALMAVMGVAGWVIAQLAGALIDRFALNASLVGALVTAVVTSLPELVITLAAIRRGALQLAVGGIIGGNTFDALFVTLADIGYREGSIYHVLQGTDYFWLAVGLAMTAILTLGQIYRQRRGPARIGVESVAMLSLWIGAALLQVFIPGGG